MSDLRQTIYTLLTSSTDLSDLVGSNIYYNVLPQNFKGNVDSVVFSINTIETIRDLEGNVLYKTKNCNIKINSKKQENIYNILDVIEEIITECNVLTTENNEVDDEIFWDEISQWFTLNFSFELNDF